MHGVDLLIALLLAAEPEISWDFASIGRALRVGSATAQRSMERLARAGLVNPVDRRVKPLALEEFLLHGLKYVFPAELGAPALGVPTSHGAPALAARIASSDESLLVWPSELGGVRGTSLQPIHPSVPAAALDRRPLYDLLALCDVIRIGRAREVKIARDVLSSRLKRATPA